MSDPFSPHIEAVARYFWKEPNRKLSRGGELRFGLHGSRSVDLAKGTWFDHESGTGGGVLDLVTREEGLRGGEAARFLRERVGIPLAESHTRGDGRRIVATYPYADADGALLFEVVRSAPKDFRQRRPRQGGGWQWTVKGLPQVPYRLPELIDAIAMGRTIFVVEGEKDADALAAGGVAATCNAGGAGGWREALTPWLAGADVVVLGDNDPAGRAHVQQVAGALSGVAGRVRTLDLPGLQPKGDVSDWLAAGHAAADLPGLAAREGRDWRPRLPETRFGALRWIDLDSAPDRHDWLVEDMIFAGDHALCYGASQSGKSFLAVDLGLAIARGEPFLGARTRPGAVLYQAGEGGLGLVGRLKAYRRHHGVWGQDLPFVLLPARVDLFNPGGNVEDFLSEVAAWRAWFGSLALVVIDTFATASLGANENASEDVSQILRNIERIREGAGCATLIVHHKNAAGERPRGHTSLYANADCALEVNRDKESNIRTLTVAKVKDGADGRKLSFELQPVEIGSNDDGKAITSCVVVPVQDGDPRTVERARPLSVGQAIFLQLLADAIRQRGGVLPPAERVPRNMAGVAWGQFRDLFASVQGQGEGGANRVRQALQRDGNLLLRAGLIDRQDDYVWITDRGRGRL